MRDFSVRELHPNRERDVLARGEGGSEKDRGGAGVVGEMAELQLSGLLSAPHGFGPRNQHSRVIRNSHTC